jgi:hypothetical protein
VRPRSTKPFLVAARGGRPAGARSG